MAIYNECYENVIKIFLINYPMIPLTAPPSTEMVCPVIKRLCGLNNQIAKLAKSAASPKNPTGICRMAVAFTLPLKK